MRVRNMADSFREGDFIHYCIKKTSKRNRSAIYHRYSEQLEHEKPTLVIVAHFRCMMALSNTIPNFIFITY